VPILFHNLLTKIQHSTNKQININTCSIHLAIYFGATPLFFTQQREKCNYNQETEGPQQYTLAQRHVAIWVADLLQYVGLVDIHGGDV
jgi:hypothetical protein